MSTMNEIAESYGVTFCVDNIGGMFGFYFASNVPKSFSEVKQADLQSFNHFFHLMLEVGVFFAPSMYEAGFVCTSHDNLVIDSTLDKVDNAFKQLRK